MSDKQSLPLLFCKLLPFGLHAFAGDVLSRKLGLRLLYITNSVPTGESRESRKSLSFYLLKEIENQCRIGCLFSTAEGVPDWLKHAQTTFATANIKSRALTVRLLTVLMRREF